MSMPMVGIRQMTMLMFNLRVLMFMRVILLVGCVPGNLMRMMLVSVLVAMFMGNVCMNVPMPMLFIQNQQGSRQHEWQRHHKPDVGQLAEKQQGQYDTGERSRAE